MQKDYLIFSFNPCLFFLYVTILIGLFVQYSTPALLAHTDMKCKA